MVESVWLELVGELSVQRRLAIEVDVYQAFYKLRLSRIPIRELLSTRRHVRAASQRMVRLHHPFRRRSCGPAPVMSRGWETPVLQPSDRVLLNGIWVSSLWPQPICSTIGKIADHSDF